jgi:hypothetical protein
MTDLIQSVTLLVIAVGSLVQAVLLVKVVPKVYRDGSARREWNVEGRPVSEWGTPGDSNVDL